MWSIFSSREVEVREERFINLFTSCRPWAYEWSPSTFIDSLKDFEDRCFAIFLHTFSGEERSAERLFRYFDGWSAFLVEVRSGLSKFIKWWKDQKDVRFKGHRKPCHKDYLSKAFLSYHYVVGDSQSSFIRGLSSFHEGFMRIKAVYGFGRLATFDFLENLYRYSMLTLDPKWLYLKDSGGPLDGFTLLYFNVRYRKVVKTNQGRDFRRRIVESYRDKYGSKDFWSIIENMGRELVNKVCHKGRYDRSLAFFDIESFLCNYQKVKEADKYLAGEVSIDSAIKSLKRKLHR